MKTIIFILIVSFIFLKLSSSFNLNTHHPVRFSSSASYFGYSVALHKTKSNFVALVGAPKAKSVANWKSAKEPGAIFRCSLTVPPNCQEVAFDNSDDAVNEVRDGMWLGMSLSNNENIGFVSVCAPRFIIKYTNDMHFGNGMCYVIDRDLNKYSTKKLMPLENEAYQVSLQFGVFKNYYAYGQVGLSSYVDQKTNELLLGAPGIFDWTGGIVQYSELSSKPSIPDMPSILRQQSPYIYSGYSVSSGHFFEHSNVQYVFGAPRDAGHIGQVYICEIWKRTPASKGTLNITTVQKGSQIGEYFGASVLAVNLNGDEFDDLIVGAPMFTDGKKWDKGRIFVYQSSGIALVQQRKCSVSGSAGARFGTTLAALGDLNQDGFQDVAVSAPYLNGQGAVYIFFGSSNGLLCEVAQRILASDVKLSGPGFGTGISRGVDVDGNKYPDILIGSYGNSSAVLLKSRPVVRVSAAITSSIKDIDVSTRPCLPVNTSSSVHCFVASFHMSYEGRFVPRSLNFTLNVTVDKDKVPRAMFDVRRGFKSSFEEEFILYNGTRKSVEKKVYITNSPNNYLSPLHFSMSCKIKSKMSDDCMTCPVVDKKSVTSAELKIPLKVTCGDGEACISDLLLNARILEEKGGKAPFIIGVDSTLTIRADLTNKGENAYAMVLMIELPSELPIINMGNCFHSGNGFVHQDLRTKLECPVGNPFTDKQKYTVDVKLDTSNLHQSTQTLRFHLEASTVSDKTSSSITVRELSATFSSDFSLTLLGISDPDIVYLNSNEDTIKFHHFYQVSARYSRIQRVQLEFYIPGIQDGFTKVEVEASGSASCTTSSNLEWMPSSYEKARTERSAVESEKHQKRNSALTCVDSVCSAITCYAGPIDQKTKGVFSITGHLNLALLKSKTNYEPNDIDYITSRGEAFIKVNRAGFTNVTTKVVKRGPVQAEDIPLWIIIVSVIAGVVVLSLIILGLYKLGFFKRKQPPEETPEGDSLLKPNPSEREDKFEM